MSNNIYDILKKIENLEGSRQTLTEGKKSKPDYIDIDRDGDKKEPMKKAVKDKAKSGMAEAVARVEQQLSEKYMGFKKTVSAIKKGGSAEDPEAVAAAIGRKKYGKEKFQKAAAAGKKLGEDSTTDSIMARRGQEAADRKARDRVSRDAEFQKGLDFIQSGSAHTDTGGVQYDRHGNPAWDVKTRNKLEKDRDYPVYRYPGIGDGMPDRPVQEDEIEESGLQAYLGKKKYGKEGMQALQKAGREGAGKEKMAMIRAKHDKMDEDKTGTVPPKHYGGDPAFDLYMARRKEELEKQRPKNEDMLSPKQKEIASMAGDPDKIDAKDFAALRGEKKGKKTEGNKFTAGLANDNIKVGEKIPGTNATKTKDIDEGQDGPEYQKAWTQTQADRKEWEKSHPGEKYYGSPKSPVERHDMELRKARDADAAAKDAKRSPLGRVANTLSKGLFGQEIDEGRTSMREGWEEMQKYLEKKRGPESKGGAGKKAGTRYGGSAQKDDDEEMDGEGKPVEKKKGRPKGTGGGAKFSFKKPKD